MNKTKNKNISIVSKKVNVYSFIQDKQVIKVIELLFAAMISYLFRQTCVVYAVS